MTHLNRTIVGTLLVVVVAVISGCASAPPAASLGSFEDDPANIVAFEVRGMACRNCAGEIASELRQVPGVRAASVDFDRSMARVALDPAAPPRTEAGSGPAADRAAVMQALHAAVEHWRQEHFTVKEDPNCLDPERREQLQNAGSAP